jgi:hypothetical protein
MYPGIQDSRVRNVPVTESTKSQQNFLLKMEGFHKNKLVLFITVQNTEVSEREVSSFLNSVPTGFFTLEEVFARWYTFRSYKTDSYYHY